MRVRTLVLAGRLVWVAVSLLADCRHAWTESVRDGIRSGSHDSFAIIRGTHSLIPGYEAYIESLLT